MKYFSRLRLAPNARQSKPFWRAFTSDPYALHQAVWSLFARSEDQSRDFLYRLDVIGKREHCIYTLSTDKPRADAEANRMWIVETKPYEPSLRAGDRFAFDLRANATISVKAPGRKRGKRHDVVMHAKTQLKARGEPLPPEPALVQIAGEAWLQQRTERCGIDVIGVRAEGYRQHELHRHLHRSKRSVRFSTIDFCGLLEVSDPDAFSSLLEQGIGRARGFGCGMMLIRRA